MLLVADDWAETSLLQSMSGCGAQMVLEGWLASLLHCSYSASGVACVSRLLGAGLIDGSKLPALCRAVRLVLCKRHMCSA